MDGAARQAAPRVVPRSVSDRFELGDAWNKLRVTSATKLRSREGLVPTVLVAIVAVGLALAWVLSRSGHSAHPPPGPGSKLAWAPPALDQPHTVHASPSSRALHLDPKRDYVV